MAIVELPGLDRNELNIQAKDNTICIAGRKSVEYPEEVSAHRRERLWECSIEPSRSLCKIDPDGIRAEYSDGLLSLFIPRSERDKPRTIQIR